MSIIKLDIDCETLPSIKSTYIYQFQINDIDNDQLKRFALDLEQKESSTHSNNTIGGYHSSWKLFKDHSDDIICELRDRISACVKKILKRDGIIAHSWVNINRSGNSMKSHYHAIKLVVCYYVTSNKNLGGEFMITKTSLKIQPEAGMLLIFPGEMYHEVLPYEGNDVRVSIACNIN